MRVHPSEYPSRGDALAVMAALAKGQAGTVEELEALSGVPKVWSFTERAFYVYGYPELEAAAVCKALNAVYLSPGYGQAPKIAAPGPEPEPEMAPQVAAYGFTPRA